MKTIPEPVRYRWQTFRDEALADINWVNQIQALTQRRQRVRTELLAFMESYCKGEISTQEFQVVFDRKTRTDWDTFGLKGPSGAMFLNMLVKYLPEATKLAQHLKQSILVPNSVETAQTIIQSFVDFLEAEINSGQVTRAQIQPLRCLFFLSAWWHLQDVENWPVFYISARRILEQEKLYFPQTDLAKNYLAFRDAFLAMMSTLKLSSWEFEQLCRRLESDRTEPPTSPEAATITEGHEPEVAVATNAAIGGPAPTLMQATSEDNQASRHTHIQWMLAKIGRKLGCQIWIARNDRSKVWEGETLGSLSIENLPTLGIGGTSQRIIELIDVVWLKTGKQVAAAFEVEHTTSIYSGLLRMSDLGALCPNLNFPFYIVSPQDRIDKVKKELSRPTFQILELHKRCGYFSFESLEAELDNILNWASEPSAIERLAVRVGDNTEEN